MKIRFLLLTAMSLMSSGCSFVGKTLGTVGNLIQSVTSPVRGVLNVAELGSERAWREKALAEQRTKTLPNDDRRRTETKRGDRP